MFVKALSWSLSITSHSNNSRLVFDRIRSMIFITAGHYSHKFQNFWGRFFKTIPDQIKTLFLKGLSQYPTECLAAIICFSNSPNELCFVHWFWSDLMKFIYWLLSDSMRLFVYLKVWPATQSCFCDLARGSIRLGRPALEFPWKNLEPLLKKSLQ